MVMRMLRPCAYAVTAIHQSKLFAQPHERSNARPNASPLCVCATVLGAGYQLNLVDTQEIICNDLKLENGAVARILELFLEQKAFVTT